MKSNLKNNNLKKIIAPNLLALLMLLMAADAKAQNVIRTTFKVDQLVGGAEIVNISSQLEGLPGLVGLKANLNQNLLIAYHEPQLGSRDILRVLEAHGYHSAILRANCGATASAWKQLYFRYFHPKIK